MLVLATFAACLLAGFAASATFGLIGVANGTDPALARAPLLTFLAVLFVWIGVHFWRNTTPLVRWVQQRGFNGTGPAALRDLIGGLARDYWGLLLVYALGAPLLFHISAYGLEGQRLLSLLEMLLLNVAVVCLVGLPGYLLLVSLLGRVLAWIGPQRLHVSVKSRLVLVAGLVPLLGYSLLLYYHTASSSTMSPMAFGIWAVLALITLAATAFSVRAVALALGPVQHMLSRPGGLRHAELSGIQPASADEIGLLTHALGRVFQSLGQQSAREKALLDNAAEGIIVADDKGLIETFNPAAQTLFGYTTEQVAGQPIAWLLPGIVTEQGLPACAEQEVEGVHRDGYFIPMSARVSTMVVRGQQYFTCLVADVSARREVEDQLRAAEARYRDLVETAHDLVWSMDPSGRWTYVNRACLSIYGYEPEDMVRRRVFEFMHPDYAEEDRRVFAQLFAGRELIQYETLHIDRYGAPHHISFNARPHFDPAGRIAHVNGTARDVTAQKDAERQLAYNTEHDTLTGLSNRLYFEQELERVVARAARRGIRCAVLYIDLDLFKYINDTLGHGAGDELLVETASVLSHETRDGDLIARFGGDEFTLLVYNVTPEEALEHARALHNRLEAHSYTTGTTAYTLTASIGVAMVDEHSLSADEALAHADLACNLAKAQGRNRVHLYEPADYDKASMAADIGWATRVREMLEHDRVQLVFQPIFSVPDGRVREYEVLMRMIGEDGDTILPSGFLPVAERFGLIHSVDRWLVRKAIERMAELHQAGDQQVRFSVNLSGRSFEDRELLPIIRDILQTTDIDPGLLTFEITETAAIGNLNAASRFIRDLKRLGCQFALDDFGSGFCSFAYLKHLPVDKLKIDGSFVQGLAHAPVDQAVVQSMNQIAHALGKSTIAEYVENEKTLLLLQEYGVDFAQGYYLGYPSDQIPATA